MKKAKIFFIIVVAVLGAYLIYNSFDKGTIEATKYDKLLNLYSNLDNSNRFRMINSDEAYNILSNGNGIVLFCTNTSSWCKKYVSIVNNLSEKHDIENLYYIDIKEERAMNTSKYKRLTTLLNNYLHKDDAGSKRIVMPYLVFVKDGVVINYEEDFDSKTDPSEYYTEERIQLLSDKIESYNLLFKEEMEEE